MFSSKKPATHLALARKPDLKAGLKWKSLAKRSFKSLHGCGAGVSWEGEPPAACSCAKAWAVQPRLPLKSLHRSGR